jgi:hypothetical protein
MMIAIYVVAGLFLVGFILYNRGKKRRSATAHAIEGAKHFIGLLVFQHGKKLVLTEGLHRFGTVSHDIYQGIAVLPSAVTTMRHGGTWGVIPKMPPPPDLNDEEDVERWREALRRRDLASSRLRGRSVVIAMRELDPSPIDLTAGRRKGFRQGEVDTAIASQANTSAVLQAQADHIKYGALSEDTIKMFGWIAAGSVVLAVAAWAAVVGFRAWQSFQ